MTWTRPSSRRSSQASTAAPTPTTTSARSSLSLDTPLTTEDKLNLIIAHFDDPALTIPVDETEASTDRGYLGGWVGGFGGGGGRKEGLGRGERFWLSRGTILRFLNATKFDVPQTITRLTDTLVWRRSFGVDKLSDNPDVEAEASRLKHFYLSHTPHGHPLHYVTPVSIETAGDRSQIAHAVWFAEMAGGLFEKEAEGVVMLVDFSSTRTKKPSLTATRTVISIFQTHYPQRLHLIYLRNLSPIIHTFLNLVWAFLDAKTASKLKIDEDPLEGGEVGRGGLHASWGGELEFNPTHPEYYQSLKRTYAERQEKMFAKWVELGEKIGEDEIVLRGGRREGEGEGEDVD